MSITNKQQDYRHCHPLLLNIPHFHHHKDGGGPIQMGVDQNNIYKPNQVDSKLSAVQDPERFRTYGTHPNI